MALQVMTTNSMRPTVFGFSPRIVVKFCTISNLEPQDLVQLPIFIQPFFLGMMFILVTYHLLMFWNYQLVCLVSYCVRLFKLSNFHISNAGIVCEGRKYS